MIDLLLAFAVAAKLVAGEYAAEVVRVIDGDTVQVVARVFPGVSIDASIRLLGADTPELHGKCVEEIKRARAARDYVRKLLPAGRRVTLKQLKPDKYAGRYDADIWLDDGRSLTDILIAEGHARPYHGERRAGWCEATGPGLQSTKQ